MKRNEDNSLISRFATHGRTSPVFAAPGAVAFFVLSGPLFDTCGVAESALRPNAFQPHFIAGSMPVHDSLIGGLLLVVGLLCAAMIHFSPRFRRKKDRVEKRLMISQLQEAESRLRVVEAELKKSAEILQSFQEKLVATDALASLGQLTAGIAHEIRNPINFVNNFAESLVEIVAELREEVDRSPENPEEVRARILRLLDELATGAGKVREHGGRVEGIVRSMLLHSHGKPGHFEKVLLNDFVDQYVVLAFHGMRAHVPNFSVRIEKSYDPSINQVSVIRQDLARVFVNLLTNAFQAVEELKRDTGDAYEPCVRVSTRRMNSVYLISFEDNGPGVPTHLRSRIFEPFFTTKEAGAGTGLGLPLSYQIIVDGHKGKLRCEESTRGGATFTIELPC